MNRTGIPVEKVLNRNELYQNFCWTCDKWKYTVLWFQFNQINFGCGVVGTLADADIALFTWGPDQNYSIFAHFKASFWFLGKADDIHQTNAQPCYKSWSSQNVVSLHFTAVSKALWALVISDDSYYSTLANVWQMTTLIALGNHLHT